ncbi:MAG TPA: hypothetical protein PK179_13370 [Spirochaetales bacterium]|nr:hypothetical protein [Spirochaetales bacterium]
MKTRYLLVATLAGLLLLSSCSTMAYQDVPQAFVELTETEYTMLGETSAEAKGTFVLFLFYLGDKNFGTVGNSSAFPIGYERVKSAALYKALQQMPEADAVIAPKYEISVVQTLFTTSYTVKVKATGIKLPEGQVKK